MLWFLISFLERKPNYRFTGVLDWLDYSLWNRWGFSSIQLNMSWRAQFDPVSPHSTITVEPYGLQLLTSSITSNFNILDTLLIGIVKGFSGWPLKLPPNNVKDSTVTQTDFLTLARLCKVQRANLTCDITSFRLRWFEPIRDKYSNFAGA